MNFAPAERLRGLALGGLHWWHCDGLVDDCPGVTATMLRCFEAVRQGVEIEGYPPGIQGGVFDKLVEENPENSILRIDIRHPTESAASNPMCFGVLKAVSYQCVDFKQNG